MKLHQILPAFSTFLFLPFITIAQFPDLRSVKDFALFTTTGAVGNTGVSIITGKINTNNDAITGFTPVPGQQENANTITGIAATDLQLAYDEIHNTTATFPPHAAVLGNGEILLPGIYIIPEAASIVGILTLDAQGNSDAKFIFNILGAFSPGPSSQILLTGGAAACNVYWAVEGGAIAIATLANMKGSFIANPGAVSMAATGQLEGRLLSTTGAINVDGVVASLPVCVILPVTLVDFQAAWIDEAVKLSWTVNNEFSFAGYDMERSANGRNFYKIVTVAATNSSVLKTYQWIDNSPLTFENFYRLKMVDTDNGFKYSRILNITKTGKKSILVYPNPVTEHSLMLQMYGQLKGVHQLRIFDLNGRKVMYSTILQLEQNTVNTIALDPKLSAGIYYLQITDPKNFSKTIRIFIQ